MTGKFFPLRIDTEHGEVVLLHKKMFRNTGQLSIYEQRAFKRLKDEAEGINKTNEIDSSFAPEISLDFVAEWLGDRYGVSSNDFYKLVANAKKITPD